MWNLLTVLVLSNVVIAIKHAPSSGLTCFCNLCVNQTCFTDGVCTTQLVRQTSGAILRSYSCLAKYQLFPPENPFLCLANERSRETNVIVCCSDSDLCNRFVNVSLAEPQPSTAGQSQSADKVPWPFLVVGSVVVSILLVVLALLVVLFHWKKREGLKGRANPKDEASHLLENGTYHPDGMLSTLVGEYTTSGSGSGLPLLIQRTIARQVTLLQLIGKGRYGEVYLGRWHGENIAVKMFSSRDENSWKREVEIYQTVMLRHENLLGFIAADNKDNGLTTQLWLCTEYYELGSLFDYLTKTVIDIPAMLRLAFSLVNGLVHLHMDIVGTSAQGKPAIAHRDLKSKNVLVKRNGQCAIADLGMAVRYDGATGTVDIPSNEKVGTIRYLAPEVLDGNLNMKNFEALKAVDVYALALIMWELCHRCLFYGPAEEYELPYHHDVPADPDIGQMRDVVCVQKKRPMIHNQWSTREPMTTMCRLMRECWYPNSQARLTALRVKKTIAMLMANEDVKIVN